MEHDEAIEYQNLLASLKRCTKGTLWKESTAGYYLNRLKNTYILRQELLSGKYRISPYLWFTITEPKERDIYASFIKDRQYQHSLVDYVLYPAVVKTFIPGNCACQVGKGTMYCIDYFLALLRAYSRKNGNNGYVLQCDIKKFFPSTHHDVAIENVRQYVDAKTAKACEDVIRSFAEIEFAKLLMKTGMSKRTAHRAGHRISNQLIYGGSFRQAVQGLSRERVQAVIERIKSGDFKGVGLGSQVIQTTQVTLLSGLDRYITETLGIKVYVRYMDDFVLVHESKEYLSYCWVMIKRFLAGLKLELNPKTQLYRLEQGITLLHWRIIVTVTGKVVIHKHRVKINKQRRKLRKQRKLLDAGKMKISDVETSFQCWQAGLIYQGCYMQVIRMRRFYRKLFDGRRAPEWNSKERALKNAGEIIISSLPAHVRLECCVSGMIPR